MSTLSSAVRYGKAVYRVLAGVGDGPDANLLPDAIPVTGSGWLTPRTDRIVDRGSSPAATVLPRPIPVSFVDGRLTYRGDPWVWLLASEPGVWRWHAAFTYRIGGETVSDEFYFDLLPGDPEDPEYAGTDLSLARVIDGITNGVPTMVGPPGRSVSDVVLTAEGLLFTMSQGADIAVAVPGLAATGGAAQYAAAAAVSATEAQTAAAAAVSDRAATEAAATAATAAKDAAQGAAGAVATDAAAAAWSAGQAAGSVTAAQTAATAAGTAQTAAETAAQSAAQAETSADSSASDAADSAAAAAASASAAAGSATAAGTSQGAAQTSATDAAASAAAAAQSAIDAADTVSQGMPSASATVKGGIRLTGDLGGTSDVPTVPGLAGKADLEHVHAIADVSGLQSALNGKASTGYVDTKVAELVSSAPEALDTLSELAAALGGDPNFATTVSTSLGQKAPLASPPLTGTPTVNGSAVVTTDDSRLSNARTPTAHTHAAADITGSTEVGRSVLTAADAAAIRSLIGALANAAEAVTGSHLAPGAVTDGKVAANAAIALSKLAVGYMRGQRNGVATTTPVDVMTEAQYQALVTAGTVDPNTIYFRSA